MSNKTFNLIRLLCELGLPALGTLYLTISGIWGLPFGDEVSQTVIALTTCLGVFINIVRKVYENDNGEDN